MVPHLHIWPRSDVLYGGVSVRYTVEVGVVDNPEVDLRFECFDVGALDSAERRLYDCPQSGWARCL